jgi:hypothetical protein
MMRITGLEESVCILPLVCDALVDRIREESQVGKILAFSEERSAWELSIPLRPAHLRDQKSLIEARNAVVLRSRRASAGHRAHSEGDLLAESTDRAQIGGDHTSGIAQDVRRDERDADDPQKDHDFILRGNRRDVG